MVFVLVSDAIAMLCDKQNRPQTQWYTTAINSHAHGSAGELWCLVGLKWAQMSYSTTVLDPGWELGSDLLDTYFFMKAQAKEACLPRAWFSHSCPRSVGAQTKLEAYLRPLFVSCEHPIGQGKLYGKPKSLGKGSKLLPQRNEKESEYLLNKPKSHRIQESEFFFFSNTGY